jgi:hypothetical protein
VRRFTRCKLQQLSLLGLIALGYMMNDARPAATATLTTAASTAKAQTSPSSGQEMVAVFPFAIGTAWTYHAVIDTGTLDKLQHFDSAITETIIGATPYRENWVFHSQISGYPMPDSAIDIYYIVNGRGLYELPNADAAASAATNPRFITDYAFAQILAWPLEVGQMMGDPAFMNAEGRNVWVVLGIVDVEVPAGHFKSCYRISMFTNPDTTHRWFCPGVGFVQYEYHHYGSRDDEIWQLTSFSLVF